eukprot:gene23871-9438_t
MLTLAIVLATLALARADNLIVTCGSSIKLHHLKTGYRLHSHEVAYSRGSQQQSVTAYPSGDDSQSYWVAHGPENEECTPGEPIKKGAKLRLLHQTTSKWLHSHKFYSPLTNQQELGDNWIAERDAKAEFLSHNTKVRFKHVDIKAHVFSHVRFKHVDTKAYLFSHDAKFGNPIQGQQEVCGVDVKGKSTEWQAAEGIYLPDVNAPEEREEGEGAEPKPEL